MTKFMQTPRHYIGAGLILVMAATASVSVADAREDHRHGVLPVLTKVSQVLKTPKDDQDVRLEGHLLRRVGDDTYIFSDGTGEIRVDIDDDDDDYFRSSANRKAKVIIYGEVDIDRRSAIEIDVDDIYIK